MIEEAKEPRRERPDRRERDLPFWHFRRLHGRRQSERREADSRRPYLVDRIPGGVFLMATVVLVLSLVDGLITISLIDSGCEEANPVMRFLLDRSPIAFFVGKYALTAIFLPVALVMNRYRLFGTRLRVGHMLPIVAGLYVVLIAYQTTLLRERDQWAEWTKVSPRASRQLRAPGSGGG